MFSIDSGSCAGECLFGAVFVQFTALKNAIMRKLESSARKSVINSLRGEVKALVASVAIRLCFCLLRAVTNLPALGHTLADSSGPRLWRLVQGWGWGQRLPMLQPACLGMSAYSERLESDGLRADK